MTEHDEPLTPSQAAKLIDELLPYHLGDIEFKQVHDIIALAVDEAVKAAQEPPASPIHCACGEHFLDTCPTCPQRSIPLLSLDELEALARAATPGPWSIANLPYNVVTRRPLEGHSNVVSHGSSRPDARYIAALYPEVVLALIARVRKLAAERDRLIEAAQSTLAQEMAKTDAFIEDVQLRINRARRRAGLD